MQMGAFAWWGISGYNGTVIAALFDGVKGFIRWVCEVKLWTRLDPVAWWSSDGGQTVKVMLQLNILSINV